MGAFVSPLKFRNTPQLLNWINGSTLNDNENRGKQTTARSCVRTSTTHPNLDVEVVLKSSDNNEQRQHQQQRHNYLLV
jgi:hypothetical protein